MNLCPTRSDRPTSLAPHRHSHSFSVELVTLRAGWSVLAAVAVGIAALVAVLTVSGLVAGEEPAAAPRSSECVVRATAPTAEIGEQDAEWVRFCPVAGGDTQQVRHPAGVVTGDLAASVADGLWQTQVDRRDCAADGGPTSGPSGRYRIEVGLADGRIAELTGDTGCSERDLVLFSQLETTLLMEAAAASTPAPPQPVTCPGRLTAGETNADGTSADLLGTSTDPILPLPAVTADVCAYTGRGRARELVDQWQVEPGVADTIRSAATTQVDIGARARCDIDPARTSYVVVLADATGTARTLAIDTTECATAELALGTPPESTPLGLARQRLVRLIARSAP